MENDFVSLMAQVIARHSDDELRRTVADGISHGSSMAMIYGGPAVQMIYDVSRRLLEEASPEAVSAQNSAHRHIVDIVAHAASVAMITRSEADAFFAAVSPITQEPLPTTDEELRGLIARIEDARHEITAINHNASAQPILRTGRR